MVHAAEYRWFDGKNNILGKRRQEPTIQSRTLASSPVPFRQMAQLHPQEASLQGVETPVVARDVVVILFGLAVVANHPYGPRHFFVVRRHCPGFTTSSQILAWIEAEGSRYSHRSRLLPHIVFSGEVLRPVSLTGVFHDNQLVLLRNLTDSVHIAHLPVDVNRNYGGHQTPGVAGNPLPRAAIQVALRLKVLAQARRIYVARPLVDIHELRNRTRLADRLRRSDERIGHSKHAVALADAGGHESKP